MAGSRTHIVFLFYGGISIKHLFECRVVHQSEEHPLNRYSRLSHIGPPPFYNNSNTVKWWKAFSLQKVRWWLLTASCVELQLRVNKSRINQTEFIHFVAIRNSESTELLPNQARINNKNKKKIARHKVFDLGYRLQFNAICSSGVMSGRFILF